MRKQTKLIDTVFGLVVLIITFYPVLRKRRWCHFGRIFTALDFIGFPVDLWGLRCKFAACSKPPTRDNHRKALIQGQVNAP